jgi:spermidine synthase
MTANRPTRSRWLVSAALFVFALSGVAGLIYQSIWSQYLGLFLGHAAYAQSLVLAIFMGGMAIGAWLASRLGVAWRNLLRSYALIELVIGAAASVFHQEYLSATRFAYDVVFPALAQGWWTTSFKWGCAAALILPQAIALGMTFPLLSNAVMRRSDSGNGSILSGLYFSNSMGAAIGALVATFGLIPAVGLPGAMQVGAVLSIVAGLSALMLSRHGEAPPVLASEQKSASNGFDSGARLFLVAAFITGASSFVYEIGWVRMLSLALGSTVHAFELMLAAFIGGLALGGWSIRKRIDGYTDPRSAAGYVQISMGLAALASLLLYDKSFNWVEWLIKVLPRTDTGYSIYNLASAAVSIAIMAPTAFFAGMTLPLFTLELLRRGGGEAAVGRIYSANTIGAIAGVLLAVHLLLPSMGLKLTMVLAAVMDIGLGLLLMRVALPDGAIEPVKSRTHYLVLIAAGLAIGTTMMFARFDPNAMTAGVYRIGSTRQPKGERVLFYRDGKTASVAIRERPDGSRVIATNGKPDASINMRPGAAPTMDEITMVMAGALPLSIQEAPRDVAVIGFGSGLTSQVFLADPRVRRVDTIEIEPTMIEAAQMFRPIVDRAYADRRSHLQIEDARSYLTAHGAKYDIIASEPSNPWVSGVASLFSREFYRFIPRHLKPGGLFVQWMQLYEIDDELVGSVIGALEESFSDYRVFLSNYGDLIIVAKADGPVGEIIPARLHGGEMREILYRQGIAGDEDLRFHELGTRRGLSPLFHSLSKRTNSDFYPILSMEAPKARFRGQQASALIDLPTAQLPYIELLGSVPLPDHETSVTTAFDRSVDRQLAQQLVEARLGGSIPGLDSDSSLMMRLLRERVGQCRSGGSPVLAEIELLHQVAAETIPYLSPQALHRLWIARDWMDCNSQPPPVADFVKLLSALANRDSASVVVHAETMLERHAKELGPGTHEYVLQAGMLAAIAIKDPTSALRLDSRYGVRLPIESSLRNYRGWLKRVAIGMLATNGKASAHASAR